MTVPQHLIVSAYHELTDRVAIMGNFGWENWSQFGKVDVALVNQASTSATTAINYQDTYHMAIGGQYRLNPDWLLNAGFAYDSSMVKDEDRTLSVPVGSTYKFGLGVQWQVRPTIALGFSYELSYSGDLSIYRSRALGRAGQRRIPECDDAFLCLHLELGIAGHSYGTGRRGPAERLISQREDADFGQAWRIGDGPWAESHLPGRWFRIGPMWEVITELTQKPPSFNISAMERDPVTILEAHTSPNLHGTVPMRLLS